jgi:hypothetical protein
MAEAPEAGRESMRIWGAWFGALGNSVPELSPGWPVDAQVQTQYADRAMGSSPRASNGE